MLPAVVPLCASGRLEHTPSDRLARALSAWSISSSAAIAVLGAFGGLLAEVTSPRTAITVAGLVILASPLLLPRRADLAAQNETRSTLSARSTDS